MEPSEFTNLQRQALLDLALVAMYSDAHLAEVEDERVKGLLTRLGLDSETDRQLELNAAIARVRRESQTADSRHRLIVRLSHQFTTPEEQRQVCTTLQDLLESDRNVAPAENQFLAEVRQAMGL